LRDIAFALPRAIRRAFGRARAEALSDDAAKSFSEEHFRKRLRFRENYRTISSALLSILDFNTVLDLGCANGFLLEDFLMGGKLVKGVELSLDVLGVLPSELVDKVQIADAVTLGKIGNFDLVSCVEVAEHIFPEQSGPLLDTIVANAKKWIYFTAASPCQPGHGHINCRQQFYWLNEFRKRGAVLDWERTEELLRSIHGLQPAEWLEWNSLILRIER
jgi:SAM-dependent methyltransferase